LPQFAASAPFLVEMQKRIGKRSKISCRFFLPSVEMRKIKIMKPIAKPYCICYNVSTKPQETFIESMKRGNVNEKV